jgi:phosphatidylserine decarboxylase
VSRLFIFLQYLLPHHALSRLTGKLAEGRFAKKLLISLFISRYQVDLSDAENEDPEAFESFNAFFTRALKPTARPINDLPGAIVSPADGAISELGAIKEDRILQAKGRDYTVGELLSDPALADSFTGGSFATVYLSPRDYHRVHMPAAGKLLRTIYVPGKLFSVNRTTADSVPDLFARNERLVCLFETANGLMVLVLVGAMIVAGIETVWSGQICPGPIKARKLTDFSRHSPTIELAKGAEMGRFKLGSTAIVLFEPNTVILNSALQADSPVRMGEHLAQSTQVLFKQRPS